MGRRGRRVVNLLGDTWNMEGSFSVMICLYTRKTMVHADSQTMHTK